MSRIVLGETVAILAAIGPKLDIRNQVEITNLARRGKDGTRMQAATP
ncbi:MAG: hypothetical protein R3D51_00605 [Hyphomicrobiaceae bacterium]